MNIVSSEGVHPRGFMARKRLTLGARVMCVICDPIEDSTDVLKRCLVGANLAGYQFYFPFLFVSADRVKPVYLCHHDVTLAVCILFVNNALLYSPSCGVTPAAFVPAAAGPHPFKFIFLTN